MPLLQQVEDDPFAPQLQPVDHDPFNPSPADVASMTHYPAGPNPAKPMIDALAAFAGGGLQGLANQHGATTPDWSQRLGAILTSPAANAAFGVMTPVGTKGITAFHGSPHDFNAFDISKIGTGEGAQAYGHGLYFAENAQVAEQYKQSVSDVAHWKVGDQPFNPHDPLHVAASDAAEYGREGAINRLLTQWAEIGPDGKPVTPLYREELEHLQSDQALPAFDKGGRTYQVHIHADPEHFLDWDKPLSEQSPKVQEVLKPLIEKNAGGRPMEDPTGANAYALATPRKPGQSGAGSWDQEATTRALRAAGIPGIKYLDQGSRFAGTQGVAHLQDQISQLQDMLKTAPAEKAADIQRALAGRQSELAQAQNGTRNYVIFDDKLISIMKKYGIAGLGALPAMGAYHFQTAPTDNDPFAQ